MVSNISLAPVVLFVYNRLDHTKATIAALKGNFLAPKTHLYIFSDGPKLGNDKSIEQVRLVRKFLEHVNGFGKINIIKREHNIGLANNIIDGVSDIVNKFGKVIVLEDDIITSRYFLTYMNDALQKYEHHSEVMSICGYCWGKDLSCLPESFFLRWFCCWGWSTWKNRWNLFERNPSRLMAEYSNMKKNSYFNMYGEQQWWEQVELNYKGILYTWAIFFFCTIFFNKGLVLFPNENLCKNIGMDGSGENCGKDELGLYSCKLKDKKVSFFPSIFKVDSNAERVVVKKCHEQNELVRKNNVFYKRIQRGFIKYGLFGCLKKVCFLILRKLNPSEY